MPPKVKKQPTTGLEWVEARTLEPKKFTYTEEGDYYAPAINPGENDRTIVPAEVLPASREMIVENYKKRFEEIKQAQANLAQARRDSAEVYHNYKSGVPGVTKNDILSANLRVRDAEQAYVCIAHPSRTIVEPPKPLEIRDLDPENKHETRKNWDPVYMLQSTSFPWQLSWAMDPASIEEERRRCAEKMKPKETAVAANAPVANVPAVPVNEEEAQRKAEARKAAIIAARTRAKRGRGGFQNVGFRNQTNFVVQKMG